MKSLIIVQPIVPSVLSDSDTSKVIQLCPSVTSNSKASMFARGAVLAVCDCGKL